MSLLHVANGHSTTALIRRAGIAGALAVWADPLHEGPVPAGLTDAELRAIRAAYIATASAEKPGEKGVLSALTAWDAAITGQKNEEVVLWFEHDLFDQLNLLQLLDRLHAIGRTTDVTLICIGAFPGKPAFKGLGELTPDELGSLWNTRRAVTGAQFDLARRAWTAFRSPDPRELESFLGDDLSMLPFLARTLRRHLEEFPALENGLSRTEAQLLKLAAHPVDIRDAFRRLHEEEDCFYIGDTSFWQVIGGLAVTESLLDVDLDDNSGEWRGLPRGRLTQTAAGCDTIEGRRDRVREFGIDRWLGGVHLSGRGPMWRWNRRRNHLVLD